MRSPVDDSGFRNPLAVVEQRSAELKRLLLHAPKKNIEEFDHLLTLSWIHHDNALEGVVLSHQELASALGDSYYPFDQTTLSNYEEVRAHKAAIDMVRQLAADKRTPITLETIKKIYAVLNPAVGELKLVRYRKETPLHRLYFHEISAPEKISYRMRRLVEWLGGAEARNTNPVKLAAKVHFRLMHIYPFPKESGKLARLIMNLILLREGYQPAIIHATDRQRYYDSLRQQHNGLTRLICESLLNSVEGGIKFHEAARAQGAPKVAHL